jgi:hypothetical protein
MWHRIGAIFYALWGALHLAAAAEGFRLAASVEAGLIHGRLNQNAWNLAVFALIALVVAITMNWRNSKTGYWLNLAIVSGADIGFVIFVMMPGFVPFWPSVLGPIFWLLGALFTTLGLFAKPKP